MIKKFIFVIIFSLLIIKDVNAKNGSGELKLSETIMIFFLEYLYGANDT